MSPTIGSTFYYDDSGVWVEETSKIHINIEDSLDGRSRILIVDISNPKNTKDSIYTS